LNLVDTAGLRDTVDVVEVEGVRRARNEMTRADRVLYVLDTAAGVGDRDSKSWAADLEQLPAGVPVTLVFNKIDLTGSPARLDEAAAPPRVFLSARTGLGLDLLRTHLKAAAGYRETESGAFAARRRHVDALNRARQHVQKRRRHIEQHAGFELFAEDLRLAQPPSVRSPGIHQRGSARRDIRQFCIGK